MRGEAERMRRIRMNKEPEEPIKQMTFSGEFKNACPYCGNLLASSVGGGTTMCGLRTKDNYTGTKGSRVV